MSTTMLSLIGVLAIAGLHLLSGYLHRKQKVPPAWLTAASGTSVAYVFIHLLPELGEEQAEWLQALPNRPLPWLETQVYIATFLGVVISLGLDRARAKERRRFRVRIGGYALYNALVGCFAMRVNDLLTLVLAVIAFGAHFLLHDRNLYVAFGSRYDRTGRWLAAGAIIAGWLLGALWPPPVIATAAVLGLVSGGIITHVIKEELPGASEARFSPWLWGAISYTVLLLAIDYSRYR